MSMFIIYQNGSRVVGVTSGNGLFISNIVADTA